MREDEAQEIPPVIACAHCGDPRCDGCTPPSHPSVTEDASQTADVAWERGEEPGLSRLLQTARDTGCAGERFFAQLQRGSLTRPLIFAFIVESLAVASFSLLWVVGFAVFLPRLAWLVFWTPSLLLLASAIFVALVGFVVLMHLLAGWAMEWSIALTGKQPDYNRGLRMGLYSCGWDLLTSPFGLVWGMFLPHSPGALSLLKAGARIPRLATNAYLRSGRLLSDTERRSAVRHALFVLSSVMAVVATVTCLALIWWLVRF